MTVILYSHDSARRHVTPDGHPEQVARHDAVMAALEGLALDRREAPVAEDAEVLRCHPARYLQGLRDAVPQAGTRQIDADTHLSPGSLEPALRAVGGACAAVDAVLAGEARRAFVALRPPGHHAEAEVSMGFCLFGTVAISSFSSGKVFTAWGWEAMNLVIWPVTILCLALIFLLMRRTAATKAA